MIFSENLTFLMEERDISNVKLGKILGVSDTAVMKWKRGESSPAIDKALKIAEFFGISVDELLGKPIDTERDISLPLVGVVSAGPFDILNEDEWDECYALKAEALEPQFQSGTYLIVHQQRFCKNDDIIVYMDEKFQNYLKRFKQSDDRFMLSCLTGTYRDIIFTNQNINKIFIQGVVVSDYYPC